MVMVSMVKTHSSLNALYLAQRADRLPGLAGAVASSNGAVAATAAGRHLLQAAPARTSGTGKPSP
jgi:hypothetical protein